MKKIGTISSAIGLILLGIWLIVRRISPVDGEMLFNFWPVIIIILGIELILYHSRKNSEKSAGFNFLIIIIIIVYIGISMVQIIYPKVSTGIRFIKNHIDTISNNSINDIFNDDLGNYLKIDFSRNLQGKSKNIIFNFNNAELNVKRSQDNNIKLNLSVYIKESSGIDEKDIENDFERNLVNNSGECSINFEQNYIAKIVGDIYVPEGVKLSLKGINMKIDGENGFKSIYYSIDGSNGDIKLKSGSELLLNFNNGNADITDINIVNIKGNNGNISLNGDIQDAKVGMNNGKISLNNKICRNIDIDMKLGDVKIITADPNLNVNFDVGTGYCSLNGDKRVNSGFIKKFGSGNDVLKVHVNTGVIEADSK